LLDPVYLVTVPCNTCDRGGIGDRIDYEKPVAVADELINEDWILLLGGCVEDVKRESLAVDDTLSSVSIVTG